MTYANCWRVLFQNTFQIEDMHNDFMDHTTRRSISFYPSNRTVYLRSSEVQYLCNCLAPLYDANEVKIIIIHASYIEQFDTRSRYVKQGVLFVKIDAWIL